MQTNGYQVIAAESGPQALEIWATHGGKVHLLLTDMMMPGGLTGRDLGRRLMAMAPALKVIYSSGYSSGMVNPPALVYPEKHFLPKPYRADQLLGIVRKCLDEMPAN